MGIDRCPEEVYKNGVVVAVLQGIPAILDAVVSLAAKQSNTRMDWHYIGGRAYVKCLGDSRRAAHAITVCMPVELTSRTDANEGLTK